MQTHHELALTIYKIQQVMLLTDFIGNALTICYLFKKVNAKFNPDDSTINKIAIIAAIGLTGVLSFYVMFQINFYLKPAIILKDVLSESGLSVDVLKTLNVSFNSHMVSKVMQALLINRIITSAALIFFSKKPKTSLFTVTTQLASLVGISALKWIEVVQAFDESVREIAGIKFRNFFKQDAKSCQVTHYFLISSSCLTHLQSTMQAITKFTVSFLNGSVWEKCWMIYHMDGIEIYRRLYYSIAIQNNVVEACGCTLTPYLKYTTIKVVDVLRGAANAVVRA